MPELLCSDWLGEDISCNTTIQRKMGNCVFRGFAEAGDLIKVVTSNGRVMELYPPITVECITNEFPDHAIFSSRDLFSQPLLHNEELLVGEVYHLLPLKPHRGRFVREDSIRMSGASYVFTPYRMSFDNHGAWRRAETKVFPRYNSAGVWKVKLVISPERMVEILSQELRTKALIESVRTVAKCGSGLASLVNSDKCSLASSWKASSENMV